MRCIQPGDVRTGKADAIIAMYQAEEIACPAAFNEVPANKALICVVQNGMFDAAMYVESEVFLSPLANSPGDLRPRRWLLMDKAICEKIAPD